jgi:tetratricopeptide (TPR) repeat protein
MNIKRYDEAYSAMSEILQMSPADQTAFYNMGIYFYVYKHDRAQAYKNFSKAAAIDANNGIGRHARYAIEFIRANPDSRVEPDFSFLDS